MHRTLAALLLVVALLVPVSADAAKRPAPKPAPKSRVLPTSGACKGIRPDVHRLSLTVVKPAKKASKKGAKAKKTAGKRTLVFDVSVTANRKLDKVTFTMLGRTLELPQQKLKRKKVVFYHAVMRIADAPKRLPVKLRVRAGTCSLTKTITVS